MNTKLTEIVLILDRSGSMSSIKADTEGGLDSFIKEQAKQPGECRVSLVQFDNEYNKVFDNLDIKEVRPIKLVPRGNTALYDAIGRTITDVGQRLAVTPEEARPGQVLVAVITDGEENASREYTQARIKEMITHQSTQYSWAFTYIGANQDSVLNGTRMGFAAGASLTYGTSARHLYNTYANLIVAVSGYREGGVFSGYGSDQRFASTGLAPIASPVQSSV